MRYFFALGPVHTRDLPVAIESDAASTAQIQFGKNLPRARFETHLALPFGKKKRRTLSVVTRAETPMVISRAPVPGAGNYPGDPGAGKWTIGIALGPNGNASIDAARTHYTSRNNAWPGDSKISVIHSYSTNDNGIQTSQIDDAHSQGFIASQSFKMVNFPPATILAGGADAAITTMANACMAREPNVIWLVYYHEPTDNFSQSGSPSPADNYRAAFRYIVLRMRAEGVTNVGWQPVMKNPWDFGTTGEGLGGFDWREYHADWNGSGWYNDITMDMFGVDTYNPLPTGTNNKTYQQLWDHVIDNVEQPGYPVWDYTQMEFGMSYHANPRPNWNTWCIAARDYSVAHRIKNFTYWDNSNDIDRYCFNTLGDPDGTKLIGWKNVLVAGAVKKVTA